MYACLGAILSIFSETKYCVMELNTFMERVHEISGFRVLPRLVANDEFRRWIQSVSAKSHFYRPRYPVRCELHDTNVVAQAL